MTGVDRVLAALEELGHDVRRSGNGWSTRCPAPAHDDRSPSLTVAEGDTVDVVLTCHAGCRTEDVLAALGLSWADLNGTEPRMARTDQAPPAGPAEYLYSRADGSLIGKVIRNRPGRQPRFYRNYLVDTHWTSHHPELSAELNVTPYRLPELIEAVAAGVPVAVVEGERDVETAVKLGVAATCNACGAGKGKWKTEHAAHLRGAAVTIVRDGDDPGHRHAEEVARSLEGIAKSVRVVDVAAGKDLTDHVHAGYGLADLIDVDDQRRELIERYPPLHWPSVWIGTSDEPDWIVRDVLERGRSHALFSPAKAGKSLLLADLVAALVTGRDVLGQANPLGPQTVLYVDMENTPADLRQRFDAMGYGPDNLARLVYLSFPMLPPLDTAAGGAHLLALAQHYDPVLIALDTVSRVVAGEENSADTFRALYRHTLAPLKASGRTLVRLDHEGKDANAGQRGSSAKVDDVDTVWRLVPGAKDGLTLKCERQRTGHHPEVVDLLREVSPLLRHVRLDGGVERPEVARLVAALARLDVPLDAGRPTCRKALHNDAVKARNNDLGEAISIRRGRAEKLSPIAGTAPSGNDLQVIDNGCPNRADSSTVPAGQSCPGQSGDSGDSPTAVHQGRPVPNPVPPGRGQVGDGGPDQPPPQGPCDVCGEERAVVFGPPWFVRRCFPHHPETYGGTAA